MNTELDAQTSSIDAAQRNLYEINHSIKSLYVLLDKFKVMEERGLLSVKITDNISEKLQEGLSKANERIARAREIAVSSMLAR